MERLPFVDRTELLDAMGQLEARFPLLGARAQEWYSRYGWMADGVVTGHESAALDQVLLRYGLPPNPECRLRVKEVEREGLYCAGREPEADLLYEQGIPSSCREVSASILLKGRTDPDQVHAAVIMSLSVVEIPPEPGGLRPRQVQIASLTGWSRSRSSALPPL